MDVARFVAAAQALEGVPFAHQGRSRAGLDCAGIIVAAAAEQGIEIDAPANYAPGATAAVLRDVLDRSPLIAALPIDEEPQAGELLAFRIRREVQHVAIALGGGRMIHAIHGAGVVSVTISALWRMRLAARYGWR